MVKPTEIIPLKLRIREGLRRKLEKSAKENDISTNAEAVNRLEASFDDDARSTDFRTAIDVLTGGGDDGKLISMLAHALGTIRTARQYKKKSDYQLMHILAHANYLITAAMIGEPLALLTMSDLKEMDDDRGQGYLLADFVLKCAEFPGVIEPAKVTPESAIRILMEIPAASD